MNKYIEKNCASSWSLHDARSKKYKILSFLLHNDHISNCYGHRGRIAVWGGGEGSDSVSFHNERLNHLMNIL